jgi:hypothetical protein
MNRELEVYKDTQGSVLLYQGSMLLWDRDSQTLASKLADLTTTP